MRRAALCKPRGCHCLWCVLDLFLCSGVRLFPADLEAETKGCQGPWPLHVPGKQGCSWGMVPPGVYWTQKPAAD